MRLMAGTAFALHMALLYSVASSMFFHRPGYSLNFPQQTRAARVDQFQLVDISCLCPRNWAERQRHPDVWICLRSTCLAEQQQREGDLSEAG